MVLYFVCFSPMPSLAVHRQCVSLMDSRSLSTRLQCRTSVIVPQPNRGHRPVSRPLSGLILYIFKYHCLSNCALLRSIMLVIRIQIKDLCPSAAPSRNLTILGVNPNPDWSAGSPRCCMATLLGCSDCISQGITASNLTPGKVRRMSCS